MYSTAGATISAVRERGQPYRAAPTQAPAPHTGQPAPHFVAGQALITMRGLYKAHGRLARLAGDHIELLQRTRWHGHHGFASFTDFAREVLQIAPRTANRRAALSRLARESPALATALESGRLSPCQTLALARLRDAPDFPSWIAIAETCTVRDLEQPVADYLLDCDSAPADCNSSAPATERAEEGARRVVFAAPLSVAMAWEHGIEMARRVLGWEAPAHRCIEAALAETAADLPEVEKTAKQSTPPDDDLAPVAVTRSAAPPPVTFRITRRSLETLQNSIEAAELEATDLASIPPPCPDDPERSIAVLTDLKRKERGLRLLLARLVRDAEAAKVLAFLGYGNVSEFLMSSLKMSKRTAARFLSEAWTFEDNPHLAAAFTSGRIGLGQAYLVNRLARSSSQEAFIARAQAVTHLQFEREVRFLERLADYLPSVASRFPGPLPLDGLEDALKERLRDLSWTEAAIEERVGAYEASDPAVDPILMRRLKSLLDLVALGLEAQDQAVAAVPTLTSGEVAETAGTMPTLANGEVAETAGTMPTLASPEPNIDTLDHTPRRTTISFWAPDALIVEWESALARVRALHGPLPTWAAALFIIQRAVHEWERVDPSRRPAEWKILERDEWRCQAPACSARRRLEVHHIIFRSHGGPDDPDNLITLCHGHHRRGIHDGDLQVQGIAPHALRWQLGDEKSRPPRVFLGSRVVQQAAPGRPEYYSGR